MKNNLVIVEEIVNASIEQVWQAITEKDKMKQWYFQLEEFTATIGFEFKFSGEGHKGEKYIHICKVIEVIPNKKLQYSWTYENHKGYSLVTFELFEEKNSTRVKLTHEGLETFPQGNPDFAIESFTEGWRAIIGISLKQFVEIKNNKTI
jgi:uncharacterized protein YndB with AHSA1/START domain